MDPRNTPFWRVLNIATPAAGADFSIVSNTAAHWLLWSLRFQLVTDANVASREIVLTLNDGNGDYARFAAGSAQAAGGTVIYAASASGQPFATVGSQGFMRWSQDGVFVPQGHALASSTLNIQAGDQYSAIRALVIEFPTGPREFMWPLRYPIIEESS